MRRVGGEPALALVAGRQPVEGVVEGIGQSLERVGGAVEEDALAQVVRANRLIACAAVDSGRSSQPEANHQVHTTSASTSTIATHPVAVWEVS